MKMKTCPARIKAAGPQDGTEDGVFEAIVATYDIDSVGDKIVPGAFKQTLADWAASGDPIPVLWSHMAMDPEYHIGFIEDAEERPEGLWVRARIDLDEPKASKVYKLLKGKRVRQFSFAYDIEEGGWVDNEESRDGGYYELRKLKLYEVGPTLIGANERTELLDVKATRPAMKKAISSHSTATTDDEWDGPGAKARLSTDAGEATYRTAYAWVDPDGDPDTKAAYKFIHHMVDADGNVGAANTRACVSAIGVLNGGRTGTTIPDEDREGVYNHLAKHLRDADVEPPELKARAEIETSRSASPAAKAGRTLSAKNETALRDALGNIAVGADAIKSVLAALDDDSKATPVAPPATQSSTKDGATSPARPGTASIRLHRDLDLLEVEIDQLTN